MLCSTNLIMLCIDAEDKPTEVLMVAEEDQLQKVGVDGKQHIFTHETNNILRKDNYFYSIFYHTHTLSSTFYARFVIHMYGHKTFYCVSNSENFVEDFVFVFILSSFFIHEKITIAYEGRRKSSRPNRERGILGEILFAIFERIYLSTLHI